MTNRTFVFGDIHGDLEGLEIIFELLPELTPEDTLVFVGDYIDCGPKSKEVIEFLMTLPSKVPAKVVCLKGNHEDGWLRAVGGHWPEFIMPPGNGCVQTMESFLGRPISPLGSGFNDEDFEVLFSGSFYPKEVLAWMESLPLWYEDDNGIYVHAGLPEVDGRFLHPYECEGPKKTALMWTRDKKFYREYRGKLVVFGHTATKDLPAEVSDHTPEDTVDLWMGPSAIGLDTRAGKGGFLTCVELPDRTIYEARED
jgi:serine/threonine protein phosphatase 1